MRRVMQIRLFFFCAPLFVVALFLFSPFRVYAQPDINLLFRKAGLFIAEGRYLEAMGLYQAVVDTASDVDDKAHAMLMVGSTYSQYLDQHEKALQYFDYILKKWPACAYADEALYRKALVLYQTGRYESAYRVFSSFIKKYPDSVRRHSAQVWAKSAMNLLLSAPERSGRDSLLYVDRDSTIRVLLVDRWGSVRLASCRPVGALLYAGIDKAGSSGRGSLLIGASGGTLVINGRPVKSTCALFTGLAGTVSVNGHRYRGTVEVIAEGNLVSAVNHVGIESYLYGVVPREVPASWPQQALMAQAVASRTYALYVKHRSGDRRYDVRATTASQVYGGYDAETTDTNLAVDMTRGQVMTYNGKLVVAYFHANSGGYTESPENVWGVSLPYLKARLDSYSLGAPGSRWEYFLSYDEAARLLDEYGIHVSCVKSIRFTGKTKSGRIRKVSIVSDSGIWNMSANNFRLAIGASRLKSMFFRAVPEKNGVLLRGAGYGHGVGMSQWGAREMALEGYNYREILAYYYRGVKLASL